MPKLQNVNHEGNGMIEVDGVRYAKSEKDAQVGDIICNRASVPGQELGEFYKVVKIDLFVRVMDEFGNPNGWIVGSNGDNYDVYKSTEEKNEVQSEEMYEIDITEMEEGDYVLVESEDFYELTEGEYYEVIRRDPAGDPIIMDDGGDEIDGGGIDEFSVFRKGKKPESAKLIEFPTQTDKLQSGQIVKLVSGGGDFPMLGFENGEEYTIGRPEVQGIDGIRTEIVRPDGGVGFAKRDDFEVTGEFNEDAPEALRPDEDEDLGKLMEALRAIVDAMTDEDTEEAAPTEAQDFKIGDRAKVVDVSANFTEGVPTTRFKEGHEVTIVDHSPFRKGNFIVEDATGDTQILNPLQLRKVE